jgi:hypothetical protein
MLKPGNLRSLPSTVLVTGLPHHASEADVQRAVSAIVGDEEVSGVVVFELDSGLCLGQALVELSHRQAVDNLCSSDFQVRLMHGADALGARVVSRGALARNLSPSRFYA